MQKLMKKLQQQKTLVKLGLEKKVSEKLKEENDEKISEKNLQGKESPRNLENKRKNLVKFEKQKAAEEAFEEPENRKAAEETFVKIDKGKFIVCQKQMSLHAKIFLRRKC